MSNKLKFLVLLLFTIQILQINCLKIDRVILSTNDNANYIEFWPIVAKVWKELIGVKPTLALIGNKDVKIDETLGDVIRFEPIENVSTVLHAQAIRLLLPAYFEDEVCITSDIDMIPLNKEYFVETIKDFPDDCFVVFKNGYYEFHNYHFKLPICYNVSKGKNFKEIFGVKELTDIPKIIQNWSALGLGWETDELMLYKHLTNWNLFKTKCVKLNHYDDKRIDRINWNYNVDLLKNNFYVDAHCLRPYSYYRDAIDTLVNLLNLNKK